MIDKKLRDREAAIKQKEEEMNALKFANNERQKKVDKVHKEKDEK